MRKNRFYCTKIQVGSNELDEIESHHLIHVLRQKTGDPVVVFDGKGAVAQGTVGEISRKTAQIQVDSVPAPLAVPAPAVIIAPSIAKGARFDEVITRATELGANTVAPIIYERTVKLASSEAARKRLHKLAISAAKQSHNPFLPQIYPPQSLKEALESLIDQYPDSAVLFGHPDPEAGTIPSILPAQRPVTAFVGPEGGLTEGEVEMLKSHGARPVRLTNTILRVETAAIALTAMLTIFRDSRGPFQVGRH